MVIIFKTLMECMKKVAGLRKYNIAVWCVSFEHVGPLQLLRASD